MTRDFRARPAAGLFLAVVALAAAGCDSSKPVGSVAGTVRYRGEAVAGGVVNFLSATGTAAQARIDEVGGYRVDGPVVAGEYKVYVTPPPPEPRPPGSKQTPTKTFAVPAKYRDATSSGVTVVVKTGPNDIPVEFKD